MFASNGPSGPTSRNERRVVTDAERKQRDAALKQQAKQKGESFFNVRETSSAAQKAVASATATTSVREAANAEQATDPKKQAQRDNRATETQIFKDHGGNVCSALTATRVTHMVGANLSGSKAEKVLKAVGKIKVVSPDWILQSVKLKKQQSEFEFLLYKDAQQLRMR